MFKTLFALLLVYYMVITSALKKHLLKTFNLKQFKIKETENNHFQPAIKSICYIFKNIKSDGNQKSSSNTRIAKN